MSGVLVDECAADLKNPAAILQQPDDSTSTMRRLVSVAAAEHQEAFGAARTVRAKHLPTYLQRKYGPAGSLHRPQQVHGTMHVFGPAPSRYAALHLVRWTTYLATPHLVTSGVRFPGMVGRC